MILIIDDSGRKSHEFALKSQSVKFLDVVPSHLLDDMGGKGLAAVFVHASYTSACTVVEQTFINSEVAVFVFSGGKEDIHENRNIMYLPRKTYERFIKGFINYFEATGKIDPEIFHGKSTHYASTKTEIAARPSIRFTLGRGNPDEGVFTLIRMTSGEIDYFQTLRDVRSSYSKLRGRPLVVEDTYVDPQDSGLKCDGIMLLRMVRLSGFFTEDLACAPLILISRESFDQIARRGPEYSALFFMRVQIFTPGAIFSAPPPLTPQELQAILEYLPIRLDSSGGRHDVANEWGSVRLLVGYQKLTSASSYAWDHVGTVTRNKEAIWYLLSSGFLKDQLSGAGRTTSRSSIRDLTRVHSEWVQFLRSRIGKPLRIVLIDDRAAEGWESALVCVFNEVPGSLELLLTYPSEDGFDIDDAVDLVAKNNFDLVLCDLRLRETDKALGVAVDLDTVERLSGVQLIKRLKEARPTLPVISFTASNKAWARQHTHDVGADGFWSKESPELGVDDKHSAIAASELLTMIRDAVVWREERAFLWNLIETLAKRSSEEHYVKVLLPSVKKKDCAVSVDSMLRAAYGYLNQKPSKFEASVFRYRPLEVSFIFLWGCLNEAIELRFPNSTIEPFVIVGSDGELATFGSVNGDEISLDHWAAEAFNAISPSQYEKKLKKLGDGRLAHQIKDHQLITLLLWEGRRKDLTAAMQERKIVKKRNKLDFIHGSTRTNKMNLQIDLEDLKLLASVLQASLLL